MSPVEDLPSLCVSERNCPINSTLQLHYGLKWVNWAFVEWPCNIVTIYNIISMGECVLNFKYSASDTASVCDGHFLYPQGNNQVKKRPQEQTIQVWVPALTLYFLLERPESNFSGPQLGQL